MINNNKLLIYIYLVTNIYIHLIKIIIYLDMY